MLNNMRRESLKLQEADWAALEQLAKDTGSLYSGRPAWRRLILRLARGQLTLNSTHHESTPIHQSSPARGRGTRPNV